MIGLEIKINGNVVAVIGGEDIGFLTTWVEAIGNFNSVDEFSCWFTASGKSKPDNRSFDSYEWFNHHKIDINDEISFKFVDSDAFTPPLSIKQKRQPSTDEVTSKINETLHRLRADKSVNK